MSLDRDVPRKLVTQGLELFFKYTGQPMTCYRCGLSDHMVKNCPKQRSRFQHIRVAERINPGPPNPPGSQESEMEMSEFPSETTTNEALSASPLLLSEPASGVTPSPPPSFASVTAASPEPSPSSVSRELFEWRKRPPPRPRRKQKTPRPRNKECVRATTRHRRTFATLSTHSRNQAQNGRN